jgi:hypothetical protein
VKKILAGALGGAAALTAIFGAGPAVADNEYQGRTYAQVQEWTNNRAVISSRVGSYLPTEECIVTGNRTATYGTGSSKILVDLNCNDTMTAGHPGYSVATEQGQKAQKAKQTAASISKAYDGRGDKLTYCERGDKESEYCRTICEQAGTCSEGLMEFLGL